MPTPNTPCAACKFRRQKCTQECIFAPYFPPDQPQKFANVHGVFGASNVGKLLNELSTNQRQEAVNSLAYEAESRIHDPVYGCVGFIFILQHRLKELKYDLYNAKKELSQHIGPQAMITNLQSPMPPYLAAQPADFGNSSSSPSSWMPVMGQLLNQQQVYGSQQEIFRVYENQNQNQQEGIVRFNNGGFDCSDSVNSNQITVAGSLDLDNFENSHQYQIQTEQIDHHNHHIQPQIFLQLQQQDQQSQELQIFHQQRSGSNEGESVIPSC